MENQLQKSEREKYEATWAYQGYRQTCHGLSLWMDQRHIFPSRVLSALDFGCGTGRLVGRWRTEGINGWGIDLAANAPDDSMKKWVVQACLWDLKIRTLTLSTGLGQFDLGTCTDVMEHIPEEHVDAVIDNIQTMCRTTVYKIANFPSVYEGRELHLTLHDRDWWTAKLEKYGPVRQYPGRPGIQEFTLVVNPS